jgi:MOSC domain-containing protein YiiM
MGTVVSIHRVAARDGAALALERATFVADVGLEGDWRAWKGRPRQITLIEVETLEAVAAALGLAAVPQGASRRQVVVRGVALNASIGRCLRVGPLLVKVEAPCDPCRNMEAKIGRGARAAMETRGGVCGRIIEGGVLSPGDVVSIVD